MSQTSPVSESDALDRIWDIVHTPTKATNHRTADRHFMADFDAIRQIIKDARSFRVAQSSQLRSAAIDALAGWKYIRDHHGDLYGVGWDRVQGKLEAALSDTSTVRCTYPNCDCGGLKSKCVAHPSPVRGSE